MSSAAPARIPVECGDVTCNILEQYCWEGTCSYCNQDVCNLLSPDFPQQCYFKCNHVMDVIPKEISCQNVWNRFFLLLGFFCFVIIILACVCAKYIHHRRTRRYASDTTSLIESQSQSASDDSMSSGRVSVYSNKDTQTDAVGTSSTETQTQDIINCGRIRFHTETITPENDHINADNRNRKSEFVPSAINSEK